MLFEYHVKNYTEYYKSVYNENEIDLEYRREREMTQKE